MKIIIYNLNTLKPSGVVLPFDTPENEILRNVIPNFGGVFEDYGVLELTDEEYNKTATYEFSIENGSIVFGSERVIPEPEPQPPSEIEQLRLEMARGNAELFEHMLMMMGGF